MDFHSTTDVAERSPLDALGPSTLRSDRFAQHTRAELTKCGERVCGAPPPIERLARTVLLSAEATHAGTIPVALNRTDTVA